MHPHIPRYLLGGALGLFLASPCLISAADFDALCADRSAIELVYHDRRTGAKPPFQEVMPSTLVANLVRADLRKETVLAKVYGLKITPALLEAEVRRINTTTRAPDTLAELKAALDNDPTRFARALARPILVERLLREKFDNDDALHAGQRRQVEQTRNELLATRQNGTGAEALLDLLRRRHPNDVTPMSWQLTARPAETNAPGLDAIEIRKRFGPDAQILSPPQSEGDVKFYFDDLPADLQNVLRVQLRRPGDVSAVIELPGGFLLYVASERTDAVLSVAGLSLQKRDYGQWLEEQSPD